MNSGSRHNVTLTMGLALFAGLGFGLPSLAAAAQADTPGKGLYVKYCGACHGPAGKGDGVVSGFMRPRPTDLTQIAKKTGGDFPFVPTMQVIDGTKSVRAHGDPDMPVWGDIFKAETGASLESRAAVEGRLMLITDYLRSIQEK